MKLISLWTIKLNRPHAIASLTLSHIEKFAAFTATFALSLQLRNIPFRIPQSAAVKRVMQIHESADSFGDILLFLPGKDEVDQACGELVK